MKPPSWLLQLLSRFYKRELDPARAAKVYAEYDERRGYARYGAFCRQALRPERRALAAPAEPGDAALSQNGFTWLSLIPPAAARELSGQVRAGRELSRVKKDSKDLLGFHIVDKERIKTCLETLITPEADRRFLRYFQSEYLLHTITFTITQQREEQASVSFRWHCDKGPRRHLKMIVYLNGSDEHGGNTEFIRLDDTARVAERGYLFGWSQNRAGDIRHLANIAGRPLRGHKRDMAAGDAVIFQPASVLHRGLSPRRGDRFVITLCLLPSPVPWQEALAGDAMTDLARGEKWHRHADELRRRFDNAAAATS